MVEKDSENFYAKYLRLSLPFLILILLSFSVFALTTNDANYSSGVYNGGFENAPVYVADQNQSNFINGTQAGAPTGIEGYGWRTSISGGAIGKVRFDMNEFYSGLYSGYIKMDSKTSVSSSINLTSGSPLLNTSTINDMTKYLIKIKPSTKYKISWYEKDFNISNTDSRGTTIALSEFNSAYVYVPTYKTTGWVSGTNDWTFRSYTWTTSSTSSYLNFYLWLSGETGEVWFDDVRLEEVGSVNLSGQSQGRPTILVTGVSDFDAVDQADTNNGTTQTFAGTVQAWGQTFTPTQNRFTGVTFQKGGETGDYTGDIIVSLRDVNQASGLPIGEPLVSYTIPNAIWKSYPTSTDWFVPLPYVLDANGTNKYSVDFNSTTADENNYTRLRRDSTVNGSYSGGTGIAWYFETKIWTTSTTDIYFKTHFEKQSSAFDLNVCSSGDSVCESKTYDIDSLDDGEVFGIASSDAPLFRQGDNNVYFMMHSDSDYNNKTPSMTAKLQYLFDKPTTILTNTPSTEDNKRIITLTCQNAVTGNCINTYYSTDGTNYTTYTTPLTLTIGSTVLRYYSTADNNNVETINTTTITVPAQSGTTTCSLMSIIPLLIVLVSIMLILGGGAMLTDQAPAAIISIVLVMVTILIIVYVLITNTCFL